MDRPDVSPDSEICGQQRGRVARRRWGILAKALKSPCGSEPSSPTDEFSVRRISSLRLLRTQRLPDVLIDGGTAEATRTWYKYSMRVDSGDELFVVVGHRMRTFFTAAELMGFNNTGNVCIWPSEEALAFHLASNLCLVRGKRVLELGGGMSCLAGLICAKYGAAASVHLTDGNALAVENVQASLMCNRFACPVTSSVLKWGGTDIAMGYDVLLCADCLFFDDARADLISTLWRCLEDDGIALVMAPKRGGTLGDFCAHCELIGFACEQIVNYNRTVWEKHLQLLANCDYDDNIHYPILIVLTKAEKADYWKSNAKKYCDFCKCWITDNKPSVEFHEKGRRHKENVARKLKQITHNNKRLEFEGYKMDAAMAKMESAAMAAYKIDVSNNADITSMAINMKLQRENLQVAGSSAEKLWHEAKSDKGHTYYWNTSTNDTVWEPPKEGFLSLAEAKKRDDSQYVKACKEYNKKMLVNSRLQDQEDTKMRNEENARKEREKLKERRVKEETPPPEPGPLLEEGPTNPYGQWHIVKEKKPKVEPVYTQSQVKTVEERSREDVNEEPPEKKFKEKTVVCLDIFGDTQFKKRKNTCAQRTRQLRARTDDD